MNVDTTPIERSASPLAYYPGCSLHSSAREYDASARISCELMGIELQEIEDWACCGASSAHLTNSLLALSLPARELSKVSAAERPVVTACAMCFSRLKMAANELRDDAKRAAVQSVIGNEVTGTPKVLHLLEVVRDRLGDIAVKKRLAGLKVACYYGCLLVRPKDGVAIDDAENPQIMDRILNALGAQTVRWAFKTECCGAGLPLARPDVVFRLSHRLLSQARRAGADCVAVACPECHSNLDLHQDDMARAFGWRPEMPVVYFTQLLGLALGGDVHSLQMHRHLSNVLPLLKEKGLI